MELPTSCLRSPALLQAALTLLQAANCAAVLQAAFHAAQDASAGQGGGGAPLAAREELEAELRRACAEASSLQAVSRYIADSVEACAASGAGHLEAPQPRE
ncbi:hypothetical protein WJX81_007116 [Elliptochloris bilobata]|uniref:Uncharacterized protein n=1 Tax=Elliptochloris bilobata TaxID=381761 RepID=A0AAW1SEB4_9CHLO